MDGHENRQSKSKTRRIVYAITAVSLLVLNIIVIIHENADTISHWTQRSYEALRSVDPFFVLAFWLDVSFHGLLSNLLSCNFHWQREPEHFLCSLFGFTKSPGEVWASLFPLSIIMFVVCYGVAWFILDEIRKANVITIMFLGAAITWLLRGTLMGLVYAFGWIVGFLATANAAIVAAVVICLHGRDWYHQIRGAVGAVKDAMK